MAWCGGWGSGTTRAIPLDYPKTLGMLEKLGPAHWRALVFAGAGEESRTPDLRITNALLYQLSYTGAAKGEL